MGCLKDTKTGRVHIATEALAKRGGMQPCPCPGEKKAKADAKPKPEAEQTPPETTDADEKDLSTPKPISKMNKDELEAFALEKFDVDLDKRDSVDDLRNQVRELIEQATAED